jgi:hypothetical protein
MNKQMNNMNKPLNNNKNKNKYMENSKNNKPLGSTAYSKNKKLLDKMLREYQSFCKRYFGESTPIGSMTEERMNKLLEDEVNKTNNNPQNLLENSNNNETIVDFFENNNDLEFDFDKENLMDFLPDDLNFCENNRLGNHKNTKNDYNRRSKYLFHQEQKEEKIEEEKKVEEKKEQIKDEEEKNKSEESYNDFENEDNLEELKNQKATIIQRAFIKSKEKKLKNKERLFFGYDQSNNYILWIYIETNNNIKNLDIKYYSMKDQKIKIIKKDVKNLLQVESISKDDVKKNINNIIDKIISEISNLSEDKNDEEKVVDDNGEEYTF